MDSENHQHNVKIEEWNDKKCLRIASYDKFPDTVRDTSVQKNIISRYLNFYLGGKVQKGLTARDLAFAVISIMPISPESENFIWTDEEYSENGNLFFLTPDDRLKYDINRVIDKKTSEQKGGEDGLYNGPNDVVEASGNNMEENSDNDNIVSSEASCTSEIEANSCVHNKVVNAIDDHSEIEIHVNNDAENRDHNNEGHEDADHGNADDENNTSDIPENLQWFRLKRNAESGINPTKENKYGPVENAEFCIYCNNILDNWENNVHDRITLKFFFAMTALLVMRGKTKTFQNITRYFSTKFVNSLDPYGPKCYTTPHRGFVKKSWISCREANEKMRVMFAKLVILSLSQPERLNNYVQKNIIRFAVLSHTAYTGMGIIHLLQQLAAVNTYNFKIMFKFLYSKETAVSWNRVNDFFKKYLSEETKQYTCHWAGIIDSESFKHLSCVSNYELAVVTAVFIEKLTESTGVWKSAWVSRGDTLEECKLLGCRLFEEFEKYEKKNTLKKIDMFSKYLFMDGRFDKIFEDFN